MPIDAVRGEAVMRSLQRSVKSEKRGETIIAGKPGVGLFIYHSHCRKLNDFGRLDPVVAVANKKARLAIMLKDLRVWENGCDDKRKVCHVRSRPAPHQLEALEQALSKACLSARDLSHNAHFRATPLR